MLKSTCFGLALETGEPWLMSMFFHAPEEGFEGQINPYRDILQHLRMHGVERGTLFFEYWKAGGYTANDTLQESPQAS